MPLTEKGCIFSDEVHDVQSAYDCVVCLNFLKIKLAESDDGVSQKLIRTHFDLFFEEC